MLVKGNIKTCYYGWKKDYLDRKMYEIIKLQTTLKTPASLVKIGCWTNERSFHTPN